MSCVTVRRHHVHWLKPSIDWNTEHATRCTKTWAFTHDADATVQEGWPGTAYRLTLSEEESCKISTKLSQRLAIASSTKPAVTFRNPSVATLAEGIAF